MAAPLPVRPQGTFALSDPLRAQLLRRAQNLCRGRYDPEDLVQEVLVTNLPWLNGTAGLQEHLVLARLYVSLRNAFISRLRHAEARDRFTRGLAREEPAAPGPADQPEPALSELVTGRELAVAMEALTRKQREVFLAVTSGERYASVAERLRISPSAVGKRAFDARRRLKQALMDLLARPAVTVGPRPPGGS